MSEVAILGKIVSAKVVSDEPAPVSRDTLHESVSRPEKLVGTTYKVKTPLSDHALYVTINDIEIGGQRRPFEIFVNSKAMENFQWIVALTRIVSAVFRKGGEVTFLVDELKNVFDPKGGYWRKGKYLPSLVCEIGMVLEEHMLGLGMISSDEPKDEPKAVSIVSEKKGPICQKCGGEIVVSGGCSTCQNCGDSKCG